MYKFCLFLLLSFNLIGQNDKPIGKFLADTIHIGEIVNYSLVFKHLAKHEVFFTDKNFNYAPFELVDKIYFPSKTEKNITIDSAIYQLRTFSIEKTQFLALPVFLSKKNDSLKLFAKQDSVNIGLLNDNNKLKFSQKIIPFKQKPNFAEIFLTVLAIFIATGGWWLIFGNTVRAQFKLFVLFRLHNDFRTNFARFTRSVNKKNYVKALNLWKKYMGKLLGKSLNSMTTTEIIGTLPDYNLADSLKEIDKYIYGSGEAEDINLAFNNLLQIADSQYNKAKKTSQLSFKEN